MNASKKVKNGRSPKGGRSSQSAKGKSPESTQGTKGKNSNSSKGTNKGNIDSKTRDSSDKISGNGKRKLRKGGWHSKNQKNPPSEMPGSWRSPAIVLEPNSKPQIVIDLTRADGRKVPEKPNIPSFNPQKGRTLEYYQGGRGGKKTIKSREKRLGAMPSACGPSGDYANKKRKFVNETKQKKVVVVNLVDEEFERRKVTVLKRPLTCEKPSPSRCFLEQRELSNVAFCVPGSNLSHLETEENEEYEKLLKEAISYGGTLFHSVEPGSYVPRLLTFDFLGNCPAKEFRRSDDTERYPITVGNSPFATFSSDPSEEEVFRQKRRRICPLNEKSQRETKNDGGNDDARFLECGEYGYDYRGVKCDICEEFPNEEECDFLSCGHRFCSICIGEWMKVSSMCPTCKSVHRGPKPGSTEISKSSQTR